MKKQFGLGKKILFSVIVFTVIVCVATCTIGAFRYRNSIQKMYNDQGYTIGEIILGELNIAEVEEYAETLRSDSYYYQMEEYLKRIETESGATYIYMVVPHENQTMTYIYDSSGLALGDKDPISAHFDEVYGIYKTGERSDNFFIRRSPKYGYLTSSILPVRTNEGKVVALLFVDIRMEIVVDAIRNYTIIVVGMSLLLLIIFCVCYWKYMGKKVINPILTIKNCARKFAQNDANITGELEQIRTGDEIEDLAVDVLKMQHSIVDFIENIKVVTAEKERIGAEVKVGTQIQADMLPKIFPTFDKREDVRLNASMNPAKEVGGDFYDFFFIDDDHLVLVCADVSGKGVPAALFMVIAKTIIKNNAMRGMSPAEILRNTNNQLCEGNDSGMFVTAWVAVLDLKTGIGLAANAGHEHPAIYRKGEVFQLSKYKHSMAVATMEGIKFAEHEFQLYPGDKLFIYTDGVTEATDIDNELFGEERMLEVLNKYRENSPMEFLPKIKEEIDAFVGKAPQFDDITMLMVEYLGN